MTTSTSAAATADREYRYLGLITYLYVTMQLVSDVTAGKIVSLFGLTVSATALYFPFTYIFSDILTEVYGYARARSVVWTVMFCSIAAGLIYQLVAMLPPAPGFDADPAYRRVFGQVPRVLVGAWIAIFVGDSLNNYLLARMKVWSSGRHLWLRMIGSTVVGQFVNTVLFYVIALYGVIPHHLLVRSVIDGWLLKVGVEVVFTPLTYFVVNTLKRLEKEDYYDRHTNFNPLIIEAPR